MHIVCINISVILSLYTDCTTSYVILMLLAMLRSRTSGKMSILNTFLVSFVYDNNNVGLLDGIVNSTSNFPFYHLHFLVYSYVKTDHNGNLLSLHVVCSLGRVHRH